MKPNARLRAFLLLSSSALLTISWTQAQTTYDWKDTAPDGNWRQGLGGARWSPGVLWDEPTNSSGAVLRFNNNHMLTMTNNVPLTYNIHGIVFGSFNSSARTINGGTIRFFDFSGTDPYISNDSSATHVINSALEGDGDAGDPLKININSTGGLTFGGTINNQGSTIEVGGTTTSAARVAFNGIISGSGGITKKNANTTLVLSGANTYTGTTTITAGTLDLSGSVAGSITLNGGTLALANHYSTSALAITADSSISVARNFAAIWDGALTGSGTLTLKGGYASATSSQLSLVNNGGNTFNGNIVVDVNGGTLRIGGNTFATGDARQGFVASNMTASNSITVNRGGTFNIDDNTNAAVGYVANRFGSLNDRPAVILNGGYFNLNGANAAGTNIQTLGALTLASGPSTINVSRNSSSNTTQLVFSNLTKNSGAYVNFTGTSLGSAATNVAQILFTSAPTLVGGGGAEGTKTMSILPGTRSGNDLVYYGANGIRPLGAAEYQDFATNDITTAGTTENVKMSGTVTPTAFGADKTINSLVLTGGNHAGNWAMDYKLTLTSGQFLSTASNRNISTGSITAGSGAAIDLNMAILGGTTTVGANINDNGGSGVVTLVKSGAGALTLGNTTDNGFSGGTYVLEGTLTTGTTSNIKYLGSGAVTVDNATLSLQRHGATSFNTANQAAYTALNGGQITISTSGTYTTAGDTFNIGANSIIAGSVGSGTGLNSLTRVASLTGIAAGQIVLAPDSIIAHPSISAALNLSTGTIKSLGTNSDLYYGLNANQSNVSGSITIGNDTAFKGISTDRTARSWQLGTINIASGTTAVNFQGLGVPGATPVALTIGNSTTAGGPVVSLADAGTLTINALGAVTVDDTAAIFGDTATSRFVNFVANPGATLTFSKAAGMGSGTGIASALIQNGGTLAIGAADALNGAVTLQAGGIFNANQAGGLTGGGALNFQRGSIINLTNVAGFSGTQATAANVAAGTIVRLGVASYGATTTTLDSFLGSKSPIYQIFGGDRAAANPDLVTFPSGATILTLNKDANGIGGILTNDSASRSVTATTNGRITVGSNGGVMAATTGTTLTVAEDSVLNGNLTIGTTEAIDGLPKLGAVTSSGAMVLGTSVSMTNTTPNTFTVSGLVTGGANTLTLDGTGNGLTTLTGGLSFSGSGGLVIGKSGALGTTISGSLTFGSGGISINSGASQVTFGTTTLSSNQTWTNNSSTAVVQSGVLALGANALTLGGGDFIFSQANTGTGGINLTGGNLIATVAGGFGPNTNTLSFGGGNLELRAAATIYTGKIDMTTAGTTVTINPATLGNGVTHTISGAATLGGGQTMAISAGLLTNPDTAYGLTLSGNKTLTGNSTYTINGNGSGNGTLTFATGTIDTQGATRTLTFNTGTGTGVMSASLSGAFTGTAGTLVLAGSSPVTVGALTTTGNAIQVNSTTGGIYTFNGASTFTGGVTLTSGTLIVNHAGSGTTGALGNGGMFTINGGTLDTVAAGITNGNNNQVTIGNDFTFGGTGNLNLGTGAVTNVGNRTITLNGTAKMLTLGGIMTNSSGGVQTTTVDGVGNTLSLGGYALSNSAVDYINVFNGSGSVTITGAVTNGGTSTASGLTYSGSGALSLGGTNTFAGGVTLNSGTLNINSTTALGAAAGTFTINGGTIDNTSGSARVVANSNPIVLNTDLDFSTASGTASNNLTLPGTVDLGGASPRIITANGAGALTFTGVLSNATGLTKQGTGTLVLSNAGSDNTYGGTTTLDAGTLQGTTSSTSLTVPNPFGSTALQLNGGALQLRASGTLNTTAQNINFGNNTTVGGDTTIDVNRPGATSTNKTIALGTLDIGTNTLSVTGGNTYALSFGATTLTGNAVFNPTSANLTLAAVGQSGGARSITKSGSGGLLITGVVGITGGISASGGNITLGNTGNGLFGGISLSGGAYLNGDTSSVNTDARMYGGNKITVTSGNNTIRGFINGSGFTTHTGGIQIDSDATLTTSIASSAWSFNSSGVLEGSGTFVGSGASTTAVTINLLNTGNTFTGTLTNPASNAVAGFNVASLGDGGKISMLSATAFSLDATTSGPISWNSRQIELGNTGTNSVNNNASDPLNTLTINTNLAFSGAGTRALTLGGSNGGNNAFTGEIGDNGESATSVTKANGGRWILSNASNSYTGGTNLSGGGTLAFASGALGTTGNITFTGSSTLQWHGSNTQDLSSRLVMGNGFTSTIDTNGNDVTFATAIGGSTTGALTKAGAGTLTLSAANTFSGTTTVSGGTLALTNGLALQNSALVTTSGTSTYSGGATLTLGGLSGATGDLGSADVLNGYTGVVSSLILNPQTGVSVTYGGTIADGVAGMTLTKTGAGTQTLSGTNSYTGGTVINAGTLATTSDANLGIGGGITVNGTATWNAGINVTTVYNRSLTVNDGAVLSLASGNAGKTITGVLSGNGQIINTSNTGFIFTNPNNTFTGTVNNGYQMVFASLGDSSNAVNLVGSNSEFQWSGMAKTFALRPFTLNAPGTGNINNNGTGALTIQQDLAISGTAGNRTLVLGGSNTGINTFSGNIADGGGSTVSLSKSGNGTWALGGTNTYTGTVTNNTLVTNTVLKAGTTIFQGLQALPNNSTLYTEDYSSANGTLRLLDDGSNLSRNVNILKATLNTSGTGVMNIFVGNNGTANGGSNSSSSATGNTISIGSLDTYVNNTSNSSMTANFTGANDYRLLINGVNLYNLVTTGNAASAQNYTTTLNPTSAPLTLAGTITQRSGALSGSGTMTLSLGGTAAGNLVTGNIQDAADYTDTSNANASPLALTKTNISDWTLTGTNTYTGGTDITAGKLLFSGANALPTTGTVAVGANGILSLADGTARNQTVSAFSLTSLASLSFDWTGSGTGDQLTSTADITPTAGSSFAVNLNRSGTPGGSVTLLTGGASSTLSSSNFYLTNLVDYTATLTNTTGNTLVLSGYTSQTPLTTFYWTGNKLAAGGIAGVDNAWALSDGTTSNWSSTTTGYTGTALTPGATADIIFANSQDGKTQQSTVLGADVTVNSVTIDDGTAVTIAGPNGAALTLMSTSSTAGTAASPGSAISVTSNSNANVTISSGVNLGANQTWNVAASKTLTVSGEVTGGYSLTKGGAGTVILSAFPTYTGDTTIDEGTLRIAAGSMLSGGTIALNTDGATLYLNSIFGGALSGGTGGATISNPIVLGSSVTTAGANLYTGQNGAKWNFTGGIIGAAGVNQILNIANNRDSNASTGGDRNNMLFSGVIANGAGGTLGLNINVASQSGAPTFVNLAAVNTFTGDITATVKGTQSNNWLVIGGEKWSDGSNNTPIYGQEGSGSLGSGNYGGDIKFGNSGNLSLSYYSSANQTLSGNIGGASANNGSLIMEGSGTLTLSGTNTYTGTTTVNAGTLVINGDQSGATGTVTVNSGGTLGGSGTLGGDLVVNDGGTHAPGNSPGLQTINGATTYNSGSIFEWDLAANLDGSSLTQTWDHDNDNGTAEIAARGSAYDAVKINGSLTVADGAIFRVIQNTGVDFSTAFWTQNQTWSNIFDVTGSVTGWAVDTAVAVYNLSNTNITGSIAQYGSFTISGATLSWQAVPEPTSALAGLLLTAGLLRRRRK